MTLTQDFCVRDCRHNHTTHNHNPAALLLHHSSHATDTHPAIAAATCSGSTGRMGEWQESSRAAAAEQQQ